MLNRLTIFLTTVFLSILVSPILLAAELVNKKSTLVTPIESLLPMLGGLMAVLTLIFVLAFLFKKFSRFNIQNNSIKVIETQIVGAKEKIMIIAVKDQQFLIGVTGTTISQLGELKVDNNNLSEMKSDIVPEETVESIDRQEIENANKAKPSFAKVLGNIIKGSADPFELTEQKLRKAS